MDIKELKAQAYDLIMEVEKLEAIKKEKINKINQINKSIFDLEKECQSK